MSVQAEVQDFEIGAFVAGRFGEKDISRHGSGGFRFGQGFRFELLFEIGLSIAAGRRGRRRWSIGVAADANAYCGVRVDAAASVRTRMVTDGVHGLDIHLARDFRIVGWLGMDVGGHGMGGGGAGVARKMSDDTGGRVINVHSEKSLEKAFDVISEELRSQYVIGYYPTNDKHDGTFRKIKVDIARPDVKVLARRGYYAPFK